MQFIFAISYLSHYYINCSLWKVVCKNLGFLIKNTQWTKESLLNKWCWENWTFTCRRTKLDHRLTLYTTINSKWMNDVNLRSEIMKYIEECIDAVLLCVSLRGGFADLTPTAKVANTKLTHGTMSNEKASLQQRKPSTKWKGNLLNRKRYLWIMYLIWYKYPKYI